MPSYADRRDAGRQLGAALEKYREARPLVIGLPRGGVVVAAEVARTLGAPLDVVVTRKLGAPFNPEFAIGAVAPGVVYVDKGTVQALSIPRDFIDRSIAREQEVLRTREARLREGRFGLDAAGRTVIVVDDGLATGATAVAAIEFLRQMRPAKIVLAVPVGAPDTVARLRNRADEVVCLQTPTAFRAVGQVYADFGPVEEDEVAALLRADQVATSPASPPARP
jgi:putative phosphoribosyl transferase